jgi:DNA-binding winged helix-turn-helix (wHTH) protein/Tol biopolymer transport system component
VGKILIGCCWVDLTRCQIIKDGQTISVEPKVMEVFECLWTAQNQVVSQQKIFEKIWPNSIFNPSSVQRSIAILRKTIEQDTKNPEFIITHPKRGYSLVLHKPTFVEKVPNSKWSWPIYVTLMAIFSIVTGSLWFGVQDNKETFSQLRPVTSSESSEYELVMSPKSDIAAFVRIGSGKKNHIWLKNLVTGKERQISDEASSYSKLGWAKDGKALAYVTRTADNDQLYYISVDPYNLSAMPPVFLLDLPPNSIESFQMQWSTQGDIYFVQRAKNTTTLLRRYSIAQNTLTTLKTYQGKEQLLTIALSPDEKNLAMVLDIQQNKNNIIVMNLMTSNVTPLVTLEGNVRGMNWHPNNQSLLISNRDKLQKVTLKKQVTDIDFDNFQYIRNASYSFDGAEIMMELINLDVDILFSQQADPYNYQRLVDTQSLDFLPIYSAQEDKFAFQSHRNGLKQLFVYEQGQQTLIFNNPNDEELFGFVWSNDGAQIISASKDKLFLIDVKDSTYTEISHDKGPFYLREWYKYEDALLVSLVTDDGIKPAKFDLNTKQLSILLDSTPNFDCAYMSLDQNDGLYFSDYKHIYTLNSMGNLDLIWQAEYGEITGFTLGEEGFSVGLAHKTGFELVKISYQNSESTPLFTTHSDQGLHLTSTSKNAEKFLFSHVKDIKKLVRLK